MQIAQKKCLSVVIKSGICTNSCIFCNEYFFKKSTADVKKMIDDAEKIGANQVLLKGAFTEMPAIIDYAKQRIGTVSISVPSSEYNALFNNGLDAVDEVRISIHDCSPSINDIIAGKNGSFEETRNFLVKITEKKHSGHNIPKIAATIVITRKNFKNLDNTLSFLDDFAIDQYIISFLNPHSTFQRDVTIQNGNRVRDRHGILLKYKEVIPAIDSAIQKYGSKIVVKNVPACFLETFDLHISSESQVNMDYLEDNIINPVSFMRICERELKEQSLVCEACKQSQSCKGIFERHAKIHGLSEIRNAQKNKQISSLTNG